MEDGSHELARVGLSHLECWTKEGYEWLKLMPDDFC
jgi:hypothetical protein